MIEKKMVIIGNEKLNIPVSNTYDSGISIAIRFTARDSCGIFLCTGDKSEEITERCKMIQIVDHEGYRRLKREYAFTIGKDVYWGMMRRYSDSESKELQLIQTAADMLNIPCEYESIEEKRQK